MITAKKAYRSPWAEKMELLPLPIDSIVKTQQFLGLEDELQPIDIPPQKPGKKMQLLYKLADQMSEMMDILHDRGEEIPNLIKPGAYRYLHLVESIINEKNQ